MPGTPQFGGTNGVPELNLGQPGSARYTGSTAHYVCQVIENPEQAVKVPQNVPQQNVAFEDNMGFTGGAVEWQGTLKVDGIATWRAIAAELNQYLHGSARSGGYLAAPALQYIKPTRLADSFGNVLSEQATMMEWRSGRLRRLSGGGAFNYLVELRVAFRVLG